MASGSGNRARPIKVGKVGVRSSSIWRSPAPESDRERESSFTGLLVLAVHVFGGLSHGENRGVQIDPMAAGDLIGGDYIRGPCLDRTEGASLDARNLNIPGHRIAGHSQVMLQCGLR